MDNAKAYETKPAMKKTGRAKWQIQKEALEGLAEWAELLAERMGPSGAPPTPDESRLIRLAQLPMVQEEFDEALMAFVTGRPVEQILDNITRLFMENV